jgi:hypothetical protein
MRFEKMRESHIFGRGPDVNLADFAAQQTAVIW